MQKIVTGKVSDAFPENVESDVEVKVLQINTNCGKNRIITKKCQPLADYSLFVDGVRQYKTQGLDFIEAVYFALAKLSDESPVKQMILANKAEVTNMCITEYNEKEVMAQFKEEWQQEAREEGENRLMALFNRLSKQNRLDDFTKASKDKSYLKKLYAEMNL